MFGRLCSVKCSVVKTPRRKGSLSSERMKHPLCYRLCSIAKRDEERAIVLTARFRRFFSLTPQSHRKENETEHPHKSPCHQAPLKRRSQDSSLHLQSSLLLLSC